jgi:hypothetical protein
MIEERQDDDNENDQEQSERLQGKIHEPPPHNSLHSRALCWL